MKLLLALSLLLSLPAGAQTICGPDHVQQCIAGGAPKPLACGKYEHDVSFHTLTNCHSDPDDKSGAIVICDPDLPICEDDAHIVTEKQWQDLIRRMRALEDFERALSTQPIKGITIPHVPNSPREQKP